MFPQGEYPVDLLTSFIGPISHSALERVEHSPHNAMLMAPQCPLVQVALQHSCCSSLPGAGVQEEGEGEGRGRGTHTQGHRGQGCAAAYVEVSLSLA